MTAVDQHQGLRRHDTSAATPTITSGSLGTGDTAAFTETYDTKNVGTGKTLTRQRVGQRRQRRQQLHRNVRATTRPA